MEPRLKGGLIKGEQNAKTSLSDRPGETGEGRAFIMFGKRSVQDHDPNRPAMPAPMPRQEQSGRSAAQAASPAPMKVEFAPGLPIPSSKAAMQGQEAAAPAR